LPPDFVPKRGGAPNSASALVQLCAVGEMSRKMKRRLVNDPNVFAGERVGTIKAALLRRLEAAGYFSVEGAPSRDIEIECYSQQTVQQCREHVEKVERFAAKLHRTPPRNLRCALAENYVLASISINQIIGSKKHIEGLALIKERDGLRREFLIPVKSQLRRLVFGKPRNWKDFEWYRDKVLVPKKGRKAQ